MTINERQIAVDYFAALADDDVPEFLTEVALKKGAAVRACVVCNKERAEEFLVGDMTMGQPGQPGFKEGPICEPCYLALMEAAQKREGLAISGVEYENGTRVDYARDADGFPTGRVDRVTMPASVALGFDGESVTMRVMPGG